MRPSGGVVKARYRQHMCSRSRSKSCQAVMESLWCYKMNHVKERSDILTAAVFINLFHLLVRSASKSVSSLAANGHVASTLDVKSICRIAPEPG